MMKTTAATSVPTPAGTLAAIASPDAVESPFGTLTFFDGMPAGDTVQRSYDALDLIRGIDVYLNCVPGASMVATREGIRGAGADAAHKILYTDPRADSASIVLTANTETTYATAFFDLAADGPVVIEAPPNALGFVNSFWQRYVGDIGLAGPDKGAGGKYLLLPPGFGGQVPDGYYVLRSPTFSVWLVLRALGGVPDILTTRSYPLAAAGDPPETEFLNFAGTELNLIHRNDFSFYEEVSTLVQEEPADALDPELAGQLAAIGIIKGQPFTPDARLRAILDNAARIASGLARTLVFKPRDPRAYYYPGSSWKQGWIGGSYQFLADGARLLDARTLFAFVACGITPAMAAAGVGVGSQYASTAEDATGAWLDGSRDYTLTLPAGIPAKNFWAIDIYDPQTRSLLRTATPWPSISSHDDITTEDNGDTVIRFGPAAPAGTPNWIQTVPGKGWFTILRLYGPLESWFDQTWRPGEIKAAD
jgi:hypothetical protein